ncbi:hypothetical protein TREPR_0038 [Treponema primitia ZAS-2]|uniref:Uncharacterized protein n=1 Tax=Treponema primitia (strain ATCC BAA-887 / DSM 12427 / ZAS-2) TaxID=545694 RepID=F5YNF0_TREPZ|nr:hypothetical protein [Treponema primitia]AEF83992.1 hypothetical protein TREPR_0038 [Treponema primitia ZAS-2]
MRNKLYIILIGILCFGVMTNCEIPESVDIKGQPGLYINLGSPFGSDNLVKEYLSPEGIAEQMGNSGSDSDIYQYTASDFLFNGATIDINNTQTYLIQFPIANQDLDFSEYLKELNTDLDFTVYQAGIVPEPVSIPLEMKDMASWVETIDINDIPGGKISKIILKDKDGAPDLVKSLEKTIKLRVKNLGISTAGDYKFGRPDKDPVDGKYILVFDAEVPVTEYSPKDKTDPIKIDTQFVGASTKTGTFSIDVDLQWKRAVVNPGEVGDEGTQKGEFTGLKFSDLTEFLGGVEFKNVPGYLYVSGLDNANATIELKAEILGTSKKTETLIPLKEIKQSHKLELNSDVPEKKIYSGAIPPVEFSFPLEDVFNAKGDVTLKYEIKIVQMTMDNDGTPKDPIKIDLVIVLPLDFTVPPAPAGVNYNFPDPKTENLISYYPLNLSALPDPDSNDDMLNREEGEDNLFESLKEAKIIINQVQNDVIDGLILAVKTKDPDHKKAEVIPLNDGNFQIITFTPSDLAIPFNPGFLLLVKSSDPNLTVKRVASDADPKFDFNLALQARTDLNISQKF